MGIVQKLSEGNFNSRMNGCEALLEVVPEDATVLLVMNPIFICVDLSTNKTCATGWHQFAISSAGIIGPWLFEENEVAVIMNLDW